MSTDLDVEVRTQLEARKGDWPGIAKDADVSHSWISQFVREKIPNPGFETLKRIHGALAKRQSAEGATETDKAA